MDIVYAALLGGVQGVTEFLPISSSGHLIIVREFLDIHIAQSLAFDAVLQLATTCAVIVYFWRDIWEIIVARNQKNNTLLVALVVGTIPAVCIGFFFEKNIDVLFRTAHSVAWALIAGSVLFVIAEMYARRITETNHTLFSIARAFGIGCFQVLAFIPGMSRSGSTISGGLLLGLKREDAVRFSFLLSIPILLGSGLKKLLDVSNTDGIGVPLVVGSAVAFFVGLVAIHALILFLRKHTLTAFVVYRIALACVLLWIF